MRKINTLKKNYEFKNVMTRGKFYRGRYITIYIKKNKLNKNVIGIAINTHLCKAVKRNHIKRMIRESYYVYKNDLKLGNDIVFLWNKNVDINNATLENITSDMSFIFKKTGLIE